MPGSFSSSSSSSTSSCRPLLLLLLLPVLCCVQRSHSAVLPSIRDCIPSMPDLNTDLKHLAESVKNCPMNCSSPSVPSPACRCVNFNFNMSQDCAVRDFLLSGLRDLQSLSVSCNETATKLTNKLWRLSSPADCKGKGDFCALEVPVDVSNISPKGFQTTMKTLMEEYHAARNAAQR